jgi:hypothetical protein
MNALLEGTEYNDVDSAIKGLYAKVGPISAGKAKNALVELDEKSLKKLRTSADKKARKYAKDN